MTVEEALAYGREHREQAKGLLEAERRGKNRSTLVSGLEELATG
jgi:plasmid stabilization system protein ParE